MVSGVKFYDVVADEALMETLSTRKKTGQTTISGLHPPHYHNYEIDDPGNGMAGLIGSSIGSSDTNLDHTHYINNSIVGPANGLSGEHIHKLPVLNPEEKYHILGVNESNTISGLSYSSNMLTNYLENSTPAIYFKRLFNRAPTVFTSSDKKFYNYTEVPVLNSLTSDPENDILYYR
jgi:hypothetical protein